MSLPAQFSESALAIVIAGKAGAWVREILYLEGEQYEAIWGNKVVLLRQHGTTRRNQ